MSKQNSGYSDKDIATNLLVTLKHMKAEVNTFSQEASNEELYAIVDQVYHCVSDLQREVFEMMCGQSWYKMTADTKASISKAYTKFSNSKSELV